MIAKAIVQGCSNVRTYAAIDFSAAMHDLAHPNILGMTH
jgi:hypothetical protein